MNQPGEGRGVGRASWMRGPWLLSIILGVIVAGLAVAVIALAAGGNHSKPAGRASSRQTRPVNPGPGHASTTAKSNAAKPPTDVGPTAAPGGAGSQSSTVSPSRGTTTSAMPTTTSTAPGETTTSSTPTETPTTLSPTAARIVVTVSTRNECGAKPSISVPFTVATANATGGAELYVNGSAYAVSYPLMNNTSGPDTFPITVPCPGSVLVQVHTVGVDQAPVVKDFRISAYRSGGRGALSEGNPS